jgi:hypothetical protein
MTSELRHVQQAPGYSIDKMLHSNPPFYIEGLEAQYGPQPSTSETPSSASKMVSQKQFLSLLEKRNVIPAMASAEEVVLAYLHQRLFRGRWLSTNNHLFGVNAGTTTLRRIF